jgi:hypothetical protein
MKAIVVSALTAVVLPIAISSAQDFALESIGFIPIAGTSTDGAFTVSGTMAPAGGIAMSDGNFAINGEFRSVIGANLVRGEELIVNGSFENILGTFAGSSFGVMSLPEGSTVIPGWTIVAGPLIWIDNTNIFSLASPFGRYSLDLSGPNDQRPYGGVRQTIRTQPGRNYRLSLSLGSNADYPGAGGEKSVIVCAGSAGAAFSLMPTNATGNQWETFTFNFTASSHTTEIRISGLIASGNYLGVDSVSVVADNSVNPAGATDIIVNGSFESACPFAPDGSGVMSLPIGSTTIPGWTVTNAELLWGVNGNIHGPRTPHGSLFLNLSGYHGGEPYGGITQVLATTPNQTYRLSFALGTDEDRTYNRGPVSVSVRAGSASNSFTFAPGGSGNQWGTFTMDFTADSTSSALTFVGTAAAGRAYLGFDNVSVVPHEAPARIAAVEVSGGNFRFKFHAAAGRTYSIESRESLEAGTWQTVPGTETIGTGESLDVTISDLFNKSQQFYRVKVVVP